MAKRKGDEDEPEITFPRLVYRGPEDDTAETMEAKDAGHFDDLEKDGWRLTRRTEATEKTKEAATAKDRTTKDSGFNPHSANVEQVLAHVASVYDKDELKRLKAAEEKHPSFDGGRVSVLQAIHEREAELKKA